MYDTAITGHKKAGKTRSVFSPGVGMRGPDFLSAGERSEKVMHRDAF